MAHERTDVQLGEAVARALEWDVLVPREKVRARMSDGWVRLDGAVDWKYQRAAAEEAVHRLIGMKGVTDLITVKAPFDEDRKAREQAKDGIREAAAWATPGLAIVDDRPQVEP